MDKTDKAEVSTIVQDFKIMDKTDVADIGTIVGVKEAMSKLKFKVNFSGRVRHLLACKMPSPVALEEIAKIRDDWQNDNEDDSHKKMTRDNSWQIDHEDKSHKKMTGDNWQNYHGNNSHKKMTGGNWQNNHGDDSPTSPVVGKK
jgi:hypothetical protein